MSIFSADILGFGVAILAKFGRKFSFLKIDNFLPKVQSK